MAEAKKTVYRALRNINSALIGAYAEGDVFGGTYTSGKAKKTMEALEDAGAVEKLSAKDVTALQKANEERIAANEEAKKNKAPKEAPAETQPTDK